jgi:hypothetical protein
MARLQYLRKSFDRRKRGKNLLFRRKVMGSYDFMRRKWRISLRGNDRHSLSSMLE